MDNPLVTSTEDAASYHTFQFLNYFTQPPCPVISFSSASDDETSEDWRSTVPLPRAHRPCTSLVNIP